MRDKPLMRRRKHRLLGALALGAILLSLLVGPAMAAGTDAAIPEKAVPKPTVTIRGNLVVENGKPTGFYELALCVKTGRTIVGPTPDSGYTASDTLTEEQYAQALKDIKNATADVTAHSITAASYTITNYPFESAAAAVTINTDALTPVTWTSEYPEYATWSAAGAGSYDPAVDATFPRGIDLGTLDPAKVQYTNITAATNNRFNPVRVRLDTAKPDRVTNATALVEKYDATNHTALLTLSANTTTTANMIFPESTPVVVVRFAYDMKRFPNSLVEKPDFNLWLGLDKNAGVGGPGADKTPLTYLAASDTTDPAKIYEASDGEIAASTVGQAVWYQGNCQADNATQETTHFYYYLGAEDDTFTGAVEEVPVKTASGIVNHQLVKPKTAGGIVLANGEDTISGHVAAATAAGKTLSADYSYFENLLHIHDKTLVLELVNDETYRAPTGGKGGTQVLFYDWDDTLIGALIVGKGDVRAEVNAYIEENMVHPDLRAADVLKDLGGTVPDYTTTTPAANSNEEKYQNLVDSLDREWTYRGKYSSKVDGSGIAYPEDPAATGYDEDKLGSEFPLTNKLDYAFYRHVDTVTVQEYKDTNGTTITDRYVTAAKLSSNADAAQYPWVYGWAVVEDNSPRNEKDWQVRRDAAKVEDVWTTFDVGELEGLDPSFDLTTAAGIQDIPATLPGTAVPGGVGDGTSTPGVEVVYRKFVADNLPTGATAPTEYSYKLSTADDNGYLRFADFSDIDSELTKKDQDVLIVKAVYEPGPELLKGYNYQMIEEPTYNKLNALAASAGGAYSATITLERASREMVDGYVRGVNRVRAPAVRQDNTYDQKWIENELLGVDHDLPNASIEVASNRTETLFTKVDVDNGEEITFTLPLSARHNKVDYYTIETYGWNFVAGGYRSASNYGRYGISHTIDNYNYDSEDRATADSYYDKQNYYYQVTTYENREGSHGFVLYGTLNYLMEQATQLNNGEIDRATFNSGSGYMVLRDANLRLDAVGTIIEAGTGQTAVRDKIIAAAKACEAHKGQADYWNDELDCAQLSYHQLQWYIIDGGLRSRAAADGATLPFCHLHKDCAALSSDKPKDWPDLIDKATKDPDTIEQLRTDEIEAMTHLRKAGGAAFSTPQEFKTALVAAVNAGCTSWDDIQYHILHGSKPTDDTEARASYWWYDGAASEAAARPSQWADFVAAAQSVEDDVILPDGSKRPSTAKLRLTESIFNSNQGLDENKVSSGWRTLTHNLVPSHTENEDEGTGATGRYTNYEDFLTKFVSAAKDMKTAGVAEDQQWAWMQYYLLHHDDSTWTASYPYGADGTTNETTNYWWKDGGTRLVVNSVRTLLKAARMAQSEDASEAAMGQAALDKVTWKLWDSFYLKKPNGMTDGVKQWADFKPAGAGDTDLMKDSTEGAAALALVKAAAQADTNMMYWQELQYYLIHSAAGSSDDVSGENYYYWWKEGGTGTAETFQATFDTGQTQSIVDTLIAATIRSSYGDPKALDQLTDVFTQTHLIKAINTNPPTEQTHLDKFADKAALVKEMAEFVAQAQAVQGKKEFQLPTAYWWQVQYELLNPSGWIALGTSDYTAAKEAYWWYDKENNKTEVVEKPAEPSDGLMNAIQDYLHGDKTEDDLRDMTSAATLDGWLLPGDEYGTTWTELCDNFVLEEVWLQDGVVNLANHLMNLMDNETFYKDGKLTLYWTQIAYYLIKDANYGDPAPENVLSHDDARDALFNELYFDESLIPPGVVLKPWWWHFKPLEERPESRLIPNQIFAFRDRIYLNVV